MNQMRVDFPQQTTKQPVVWICQNALCRERNKNYEFEADEPICPKCQAAGYPYVQKRILVHLLVSDPEGLILGASGPLSILCDSGRGFIATYHNGEAGTGETAPVNCPGCRKLIKEQGLKNIGGSINIVQERVTSK